MGRLRILRSCAVATLILSAAVAGAGPHAAPAEILTTEAAREMVEELLPEVERLRGLPFKKPVPVEVVGKQAVREHLMDRVDKLDYEESLRGMGRAYQLLQLLPPGTDLLEEMAVAVEDQAGGFYDPSRGSYYLMERVAPVAAPIFTVHELTHAIEDQHFDLDRRIREVIGDEDRAFARGAVHEGSATLVMTLYTVEATIRGELDVLALQEVALSEAANTEKLADLADVIVRQLLGPYVLGTNFLTRGNVLGAMGEYPFDDVSRAFDDPPQSSEQILHPDKYWVESERDDPRVVDLNEAARVLGRKWTLASRGTVGEIGIGSLVGAPTPLDSLQLGILEPGGWTNRAAAGWGGDLWELWERGDSAVVLWSTSWDSAKDAREFADALAEQTALEATLRDDRVVIVAGDAGRKRKKLIERMFAATD